MRQTLRNASHEKYDSHDTAHIIQTASSTAPVRPEIIQPRFLWEQIVDIVQRDIIAGNFRPGQRLPERELIHRFGVSSIPVREALQELESRGLVVRRHNCGYSVIQLTHGEAARICELRRVLEPKVMEWAAERITPAATETLREQLDRAQKAADSGDWSTYFQEDLQFHRMIWHAADNRYATQALETVLGSLFASGFIRSKGANDIDLRADVDKHRRLFDAIRGSDGQRAASCLLEIAAGFEKHVG
jgi:DNA-binding GntR family transcriptional regulator